MLPRETRCRPLGGRRSRGAHPFAARPPAPERNAPCAIVRGAIAGRDQQRQMTPDDLLRLISEDLLGALIEVDDPLLLIDADDRIGGDAENARELRLGLAQACSAFACSATRSSSSRWRDSSRPTVAAAIVNAADESTRASPSRPISVSVIVEATTSATAAIHSAVRMRREWTTGTESNERSQVSVERPSFKRELNVVRTMRQTQLLLNALFVRVDGLRADEELLADLRSGVPLSDEAQARRARVE